jgi:hypothetical protein
MKAVVYLVLSLIPISSGAQALSGRPTSTPPGTFGTTVTPSTTPPANASAGAPALAVNAAALTNNLSAFGFTNQFGTNFTSGDLASVLIGLQSHLQQALVLLSGFNGNLNIGTGPTPAGGGLGSFGQNLGVSAGQNLSVNLGQNVAASTAPAATAPAATPPSVFAQPSQATAPAAALAAPPANPVTNITGVPVTPGANVGAGSLAINNSLRLLIILQNDMERLLPEVAAATGVPLGFSLGGGPFGTNSLGAINNTLGAGVNNANTGTPRIPARTTAPRALTPTGR